MKTLREEIIVALTKAANGFNPEDVADELVKTIENRYNSNPTTAQDDTDIYGFGEITD